MPNLLSRKLVAAFLALFAVLVSGSALHASADSLPFVSTMFGDNMVLQRDMVDHVWGWTDPGSTVTVSVGTQSTTVYAGKDGRWMANLGPMPAGGPYTLDIAGPQHVTFNNIMMGDVWICSGQSNMAFGVAGSSTGADAVASANYPDIRLMRIPNVVSGTPVANLAVPSNGFEMHWQVCSPQTVGTGGWGGFSAVGFYFGRHLYNSLKVPIGLIMNPWSGMPAESFVSRGTLSTLDAYKARMDQMGATPDQATLDAQYGASVDKWFAANDPGSFATAGWSATALDDSSWGALKTGVDWRSAGVAELANFNGVLWYRTSFTATNDWVGKPLSLSLGTVGGSDTTFVNGVKVGATGGGNAPRVYTVPASAVVAGNNVIAVRIVGGGGLNGKPNNIYIEPADDPTAAITLSTDPWKYKIGVSTNTAPPMPGEINLRSPATPTVLYNAMVYPLLPMAVKGAIWYQGESNASRAYEYRDLMPALIADWRKSFGEPQMPFFLVQLASFAQGTPDPASTQWAELREAQLMTVQKVPKTGMAVAIDIGDPHDIHPKDKQDVGDRLALNALAIAYGQKIEYSGPIYKSMKVEGGKVTLSFTHADGLTAKGGDLTGFKIAGPDHVFVPATATIVGDTVVVSASAVAAPQSVRYAFEIYPEANLYNAAGLPASPFRTDDWPGVTVNSH